jgi:hypothetical protein
MSYSPVGIVNLALGRIGAKIIASLSENSPNAIKANAVWEYCRDEVLQAKDWKFAKLRYEMQVSTTKPLYGYGFAYPLPSDFLRLVRPRQNPFKGLNPAAYSPGYSYTLIDTTGYSRFLNFDPPVFPPGFPYVIETLPDTGQSCMFTGYDNTNFPLYINYIRRVTDATKYTPAFINSLANRVGAELATAVTENAGKFKDMMGLYALSLETAQAQNESIDYLEDEAGGDEWLSAGR